VYLLRDCTALCARKLSSSLLAVTFQYMKKVFCDVVPLRLGVSKVQTKTENCMYVRAMLGTQEISEHFWTFY
jgi:hypothetical protein